MRTGNILRQLENTEVGTNQSFKVVAPPAPPAPPPPAPSPIPSPPLPPPLPASYMYISFPRQTVATTTAVIFQPWLCIKITCKTFLKYRFWTFTARYSDSVEY